MRWPTYLPPALLVWNVGNVCSIYATLYLGLTVGFPLTQLALAFGGLIGIFWFKEITGVYVIAFWMVSIAVLLTGAVLLGMFG
jgi:glucose uptake protein GlcU